MKGTEMKRSADLAASIEATAESLVSVLDLAAGDRPPRVSPMQLRVLTWLRAHPATNVNGLAESLGVGASSASRLCDRLEALGLVRRTADPRDRREVQVIVTPEAVALLDDLSRVRRDALARVLDAMSPSARRELARSLASFNDAFEALNEVGATAVQAGALRQQTA